MIMTTRMEIVYDDDSDDDYSAEDSYDDGNIQYD